MSVLEITVAAESWRLRDTFNISRGAKVAADVIVVTARSCGVVGRGEAVPYARYGETLDGALAEVRGVSARLANRAHANAMMRAGAARNAVDCALWDLEAKRAGVRVSALAGVCEPKPTLTAFTISLDAPDVMAEKARRAAHLPLLKLKLGGAGDDARMRAVRAARPDARLIVDANEAWTLDLYPELSRSAADCGVEVIEQPFAADSDDCLAGLARPVPVCADESVHTAADLARIAGLYDAVNIKLDKAGGLTAALALAERATQTGLAIMVGSMVATSLAAAPALLLARSARWVDLDGPLLLARDRDGGLTIRDGVIEPPSASLWG